MEDSGSADRLSSLPDDLLHLVLLRLGCAHDAARASVLSSRWPRVCSGLPKPDFDVTLHDVPLDSLEDALRRADGPGVRLLDIRAALGPQDGSRARFGPPAGPQDGSRPQFVPPVVPQDGSMPPFVPPVGPLDRYRSSFVADRWSPCVAGTSVSAVLRAAVALAPVELRFMLTHTRVPCLVGLPRFLRATSMELQGLDLRLHLQPSQAGAGFPLLERLTLSGCNVDLGVLIPNCPRLQVLTVDDFTVYSTSLQELLVKHMKTLTGRAEARTLRQLTALSFLDGSQHSWSCSYPKVTHGLGLWGLLELGLTTAERHGDEVLSLQMGAQDSLSFQDQERGFAAEIGKHVVTQFSTLNLHHTTKGHAFGAFVLRLLGMHRLKDIQNFNIDVSRSEVKEACPLNCPCDGPKGWKSQTISLNLRKVKIEGFKGENHELDFLKVVLRCSPTLKSVIVKLPDQDMPSDDWCTKIHNIFGEYPYVEGNIDLISG